MGYNFTLKSFQKLYKRSIFGVLHNLEGKLSTPELRFIQYQRKNDSRLRLGAVSQDGTAIIELSGGSCVSNSMLSFLQQSISAQEIQDKLKCMLVQKVTDDIKLLPPITNPGKIVCVGLNYMDHCQEQNAPVPKEPVFFSKLSSSVIGPRDCIIANQQARRLDYEVELAVIIGRICQDVPIYRALDHVFGYSVAQDITARDWQKPNRNGGQWFIGKSMDTFCPLGPTIVHRSLIPDVQDLQLTTCVNGETRQCGYTRDMIFSIDEIICRLSRLITLYPGDIILTGTPAGVGAFRKPPEFLKPGDCIETHIHNIGTLRNLVIPPLQCRNKRHPK